MAAAMEPDVEPDSDDDTVGYVDPLIIDETVEQVQDMAGLLQPAPEGGSLSAAASLAPKTNKTSKKSGKNTKSLGSKPAKSGAQPKFALISDVSSTTVNSPAASKQIHFVENLDKQVTVQISDEFQTVVNKKAKRQLDALSTDDSSEDETTLKKRAVSVTVATDSSSNAIQPTRNGNDTLYIRGVGYNFAAAVRRQPTLYTSEIVKICGSDVDQHLWKFSGETFRINIKNAAQRSKLLQVTDLCGKSVEISEPWSVTRRNDRQIGGGPSQPAVNTYAQARASGQTLGVVYGVPADVSPDQIKDMASAASARRLTPQSGEMRETDEVYSVLLGFNGELPQFVQVAPFLRLRINAY